MVIVAVNHRLDAVDGSQRVRDAGNLTERDDELSAKTALVTGASAGLGAAIARHLASLDMHVVVSGRRGDVLDVLAGEIGATPIAVDLASDRGPSELADRCGPVDVFVSNAALPASGDVLDFSADEIDRAVAVNLRAPMMLTRLLLVGMLQRNTGHLVFVGSLGGKAASPHAAVYSATKFGLRGFTQSLRQDLHRTGVSVSLVLPGPIRDAGMWAETGVALPRGLNAKTPSDVAHAVSHAITHRTPEITVAALPLRLAASFSGIAPTLTAALQRRSRSGEMMAQVAAAQRHKR